MRGRKLKPPDPNLPEGGDAFLMPLADGRFGVCRVLRRTTEAEAKAMGGWAVLAAASPWVGRKPPRPSNPRLREVLVLTHHSWQNEPEMNWVSDPPPEGFRKLGVIEPTPREAKTGCRSFGGWASFPLQVLLQWRWDHDRAAVLREDEEEKRAWERKWAEAAAQRQARLAAGTLGKLWRKKRFAGWEGDVPRTDILACRAILGDAVDALIALGPKPNPRSARRVLRQSVEALNRLDRERNGFICTIEREDLCEEIAEIADACGLKDADELADEWRDW